MSVCVCLLLIGLRYLGLAAAGELPAERPKKNHNAMARFEWALTGPGIDKKEQVVVRSDYVKRRRVPLPVAWTQITSADVQKECEKAAGKMMALLMVETLEWGAMITCQPHP